VEVEDATSPFEVRDVLQRLLGIAELERTSLALDYLGAINTLSANRYMEFLEI
jgi:hypothetical protein